MNKENLYDIPIIDTFRDRIMDINLQRYEQKNEYPIDKLSKFKQDYHDNQHCSLMSQFMTPEIFNRYKDIDSGGNGRWTISRAINTGIIFPRSIMGLHAGDAESYDTFIDIYKPCVEAYLFSLYESIRVKTQENCVDISNKYRLGYSEVQLVDHMIVTVNILAAMEHVAATVNNSLV
jgi:hypothetical protein